MFPNIRTAKTFEEFERIAKFNDMLILDYKVIFAFSDAIKSHGQTAYEATQNDEFILRSNTVAETLTNAANQFYEFIYTLHYYYPEVFPTREQFDAQLSKLQ